MTTSTYRSGDAIIRCRTRRPDGDGERWTVAVTITGLPKRSTGVPTRYRCAVGIPEGVPVYHRSAARSALAFADHDGWDTEGCWFDEHGYLVVDDTPEALAAVLGRVTR